MISIIIILEGADLVGKTSIAEQLSIMTGLPKTSIWIDLEIPKPAVISVAKTLRLIAESTKLNVIFDRSFISEYVYGSILGRDITYIPELISEWSSVKDCHLVIITASDDILKERFSQRGDTYVGIEEILEINREYKNIKAITEHAICTYEIDSSNFGINELSLSICDMIGLK